ncbi:MAG: hypothetical protein JNM86_10485 [Phycisphaerae bacterium]|nr:hypothetical protein [Phycisphaerae bacterium]
MSLTQRLPSSWRVGAPAVLCIVGVSSTLIVLYRGGSPPAPSFAPPTQDGRIAIVVATPPPSTAPQNDTEYAAAFATAFGAIKSALAKVQVSAPSSSDAASIATEAADTFDLAINPSVEKYLAYLERRGEADGYFAKLKDVERDTYLRSKSQSFASQNLDLEKAQVRWRYIDGREIEVPKEIGGYATPKRTFDAVMNPSASGLTVMEVIIPVEAKTVVMGTKPCRLGIWIGKTREKPSWTTMRIYTYDVPGNAGVISPPF